MVVLVSLGAFLGRVWSARIANNETAMREAAIAKLRGEIDKYQAEFKAQLDRQATEFKAQIDISAQKAIFIDKTQFEHEYEIYKLAWEKLVVMQQATLKLRPLLDYIDHNETKAQRMSRRIGDLTEPYNEYSALIEKNKPFYPELVYAALIEVRNKCHDEVIAYEFTERSSTEYWNEAKANHEEIQHLIDLACQAIRERIASVRVTNS